jgi:hypothetical protein
MTSDEFNVIGSESKQASQGKKATFERKIKFEQQRSFEVYRKSVAKVMNGRRFRVIQR